MVRFIALLATLLLLGGCEGSLSHLIQRKQVEPSASDQPLIYTLDDRRRVAFGRVDRQQFCAEPPATATEQMTQILAAAIRRQPGGASDSAAEAAQIEQIYQRAHSLQLFRDAAFFLCINALNQAPGSATSYQRYEQSVSNLIEQLRAPLQEEIRLYYQVESVRSRASRQEVIVCAPSPIADGEQGGVNCQRLRGPAERNPSVIDPPRLPDGGGTRPVM